MALLAGALLFGGTGSAASDEPTGADAASAANQASEIGRLLDDLNSDRFDVRRRAVDRLQALAKQPEFQGPLAAELQRLLLRPDTPFEVRAQAEPLRALLPPAETAERQPPANEELDLLLKQADARSYNLRVGAAARLAWLAKDERSARRLADRLKQRMADPDLSSDARKRLLDIWQSARGTWLASDPASWPPPACSDAQLAGWIGDLVGAESPSAAQDAAHRDLLDLLAYDGEVARVRAALEQRLAAGELTPDAEARLSQLVEWTMPAMAAEIWTERRHATVQYLLVGVAQHPEGAPRATHFDRIDDRTAHCVSGNSLAPGDYPVGVALPPTHNFHDVQKEGLTFHLINLPTPRRRLLYDYQHLKIDEPRRLAALSERTIDWMVARRRAMTEREISMLAQLDTSVVSRRVGEYLLAAPDEPKVEIEDFALAGRASRHAMLVTLLSQIATHEAIPGIVEAIDADRFLTPTAEAPYYLPWLSVLAIAQRDPWPEIDSWLAGLVERTDPLSALGERRPEVGATAAVILLDRHGVAPAEFGLEEVTDQQIRGLGFGAYRFIDAAKRAEVLRWWQQHRERALKRAGA